MKHIAYITFGIIGLYIAAQHFKTSPVTPWGSSYPSNGPYRQNQGIPSFDGSLVSQRPDQLYAAMDTNYHATASGGGVNDYEPAFGYKSPQD